MGVICTDCEAPENGEVFSTKVGERIIFFPAVSTKYAKSQRSLCVLDQMSPQQPKEIVERPR